MFEEIFHLLSQLGIAGAARPLCDLLLDISGESMTLQQLQQEIRNLLRHHGGGHCANSVISALLELGYAGLAEPSRAYEEESEGAGAAVAQPGASATGDSPMLAGGEACITLTDECACHTALHETARGWLDIDSGIYFDDGQHGAGSDPEK